MSALKKTSFFTATTLKAPFAWVGGKSRLAKDIIALMPPHKRYIEVFAGGLSVLYAKPKLISKDYVEIINDINSDLINLHTIIKTRPQSFAIELNNIFLSREVFSRIKNGTLKPRNDIQKAAFYYYLLTLSFGSKGDHFAMPKTRAPKNIYRDYTHFAHRLKGVCIENMEFADLLVKYDSKETLFYCDPPYVGTEDYYKTKRSFTLKDHQKLCEILKNLQGKFILSYNDCPLIRELYKDFRILQSQAVRYSINIKSTKKVKEVLIINY